MGPAELACLVSEALEKAGIEAVLSGGGAVSVYTENEYESSNLDFVTSTYVKELETALSPLGFKKGSGRAFEHSDTDYYLEFPPGPLAAGGEVFSEWDELETDFGTIQILSPTQIVKDRLAAYIHWNDQPSLEQAIMVAKAREIDYPSLEEWVAREDGVKQYETFRRLLAKTGR